MEQDEKSAGQRRASLWALIVFLFPLAMSGLVLWHWYLDAQMDQRAKVTTGLVTKVEADNHQQIDYEFTVDGKTYNGGDVIAAGALPSGAQVRVFYLPESPETNSLTGFGGMGARPIPILFSLFVGIAGYFRLRRFFMPPTDPYER